MEENREGILKHLKLVFENSNNLDKELVEIVINNLRAEIPLLVREQETIERMFQIVNEHRERVNLFQALKSKGEKEAYQSLSFLENIHPRALLRKTVAVLETNLSFLYPKNPLNATENRRFPEEGKIIGYENIAKGILNILCDEWKVCQAKQTSESSC